MKKYVKLISLTTFIIVVLAAFYVNAQTVSNSFPQFTFKKIDGKEKAVESLVVDGDMYFGMLNYEPFQIDNQGTNYLRSESFKKRLNGHYLPAKIEKLQQEYRSFMRGKEEGPDSFYENDKVVAYGATPYDMWSVDNYGFEVAVLDKQTNKTTSFSLPIPNRGDYWNVASYGVYMDGNELSIVTINDQMDHTAEIESSEVHIYTFNVDKEQLVNEEVIGPLNYSSTENGYNDINLLINETSDSDHLVVVQNQVGFIETPEDKERHGEEMHTTKLMKYNFKSKTTEEISLPEKEHIGIPFAFNGKELSFANFQENHLQFTNYHVDEQKTTHELEVNVENTNVYLSDIYEALVKDDTFYFLPTSTELEGSTPIVVVDLKELQLNYYGQIEHSNAPKYDETTEVYFNGSDLKD